MMGSGVKNVTFWPTSRRKDRTRNSYPPSLFGFLQNQTKRSIKAKAIGLYVIHKNRFQVYT